MGSERSRGVGRVQQRGGPADAARQHARKTSRELLGRAAARAGVETAPPRGSRLTDCVVDCAAIRCGRRWRSRACSSCRTRPRSSSRSARPAAAPGERARRLRLAGRQDARLAAAIRGAGPARRGATSGGGASTLLRETPGQRGRRSGADRQARSRRGAPVQATSSTASSWTRRAPGSARSGATPDIRWRRAERRSRSGWPRRSARMLRARGDGSSRRAAGWSTPPARASPRRTRTVAAGFLSGASGLPPGRRADRCRAKACRRPLVDAAGHLRTRPDLHGLEAFFARRRSTGRR